DPTSQDLPEGERSQALCPPRPVILTPAACGFAEATRSRKQQQWPSSRRDRTIPSFNDRKNKEPSHGSATYTARTAAVRHGAIAHPERHGKEEGARPAADAHGRTDQQGPAALHAIDHELDQRPARQADKADHARRYRPPARLAEAVMSQRRRCFAQR